MLLALGAMPLLALLGAGIYATVVFWPAMLLFGAVHSFLPFIPAFGAGQTWVIVALLALLIPHGSASSN